ncbi:ATP-binding protein [Janibacter sp. G56]|uniref:ATP-binding protein n=1 Tax=Janibacter sp. G56 TaxID=3418717 RepID=UPI003D030FCC
MALIDDLLARLRVAGGDTTDVEVKSAAGGLPTSMTSTLCALANLPGGGWVVLGLDEKAGFAPVELGDVNALRQGLAGKARACSPPVQVTFHDAEVAGRPVVVAAVAECSPSAKPCRVVSTGSGWVRFWDGDFTMSAVEEQAFLAQRQPPHFDRSPVEGATMADLDQDLVAVWAATVAERDQFGLGRFTGRELLFRAGIVTADDVPTKAGLLALGVHPQQFFPRYLLNLSVTSQGATRAVDPVALSGPIPVMLDGALEWARRVFTRAVVERDDGSVHDAWTYPLEAFRELVANALVHRDLDAWSEGAGVEVRLTPDRLVVTNPGGLYGVTVDRLGRQGVTSARNGRLLEVCRYARSKADSRVVEALASGIPRVISSMAEQGHPPPQFQDSGIRFTVLLRSRAHQRGPVPGANESVARKVAGLGPSERRLWDALGGDEVTVVELERRTGLKAPNIRRVLRALVALELVARHGGQGHQGTTYARVPGAAAPP